MGKYILRRRIAVGGMGEIFHGKIAGIAGFEREVAIKKMLPHLTEDKNFIDMMIKEAKLTVLLNHPNIVQVYDLAKEGDEYYIAMEYVPGVNVGTLLETCRKSLLQLPVEVAIHITLNMLKGLAYAHDLTDSAGNHMGVLHRDVTPQNILVTQSAWVKITDFGIAKARNEISTTSPGMIKGKLGYIAPEQLTGVELDQRVDIFCAGIVFWECLACRRLFKGTSEIDTFRLIAEAKVPPMSEIRDDVPEGVELVLQRALSRDRDDRYSSCQEFYDALALAVFPRTPDDCLNTTQAFFATHNELFASLDVGDDDELEDEPNEPTVQLATDAYPSLAPPIGGSQGAPSPEDSRAAVEDRIVTRPVPPPQGRSWVLPALLGLLVSAVAVAAFALREQILGQLSGDPRISVVGMGTPPLSLSTEEIQLGVDAEAVRITDCYQKGGPELRKIESLRAELVVASTGGVASVRLMPDLGGRAGKCVEEVLQRLDFRRHQSPQVTAQVNLPPPKDHARSPAPPSRAAPVKPLTPTEIQATVGKYSSGIAKCIQNLDPDNTPPEVRATIRIETSGRVSSVELRPSLGNPAAQACLTRALKGMRFRKHPDKNLAPITIPLKIKKA